MKGELSVRRYKNEVVTKGYVFFFNDTATTEIYTLSLHDALPISLKRAFFVEPLGGGWWSEPPGAIRLTTLKTIVTNCLQ